MVLIIEVICIIELVDFISFFLFLTTSGHKNAHNLATFQFTIFSKLHHVPHMILHQIV